MISTSNEKLKLNGTDKAFPEVLTPEAVDFLVALHEKFNAKRLELLKAREERQVFLDAGNFPSFPAETKDIREGDWVAAPLPEALLDRRVEITGPVDRKMVINALNSGAKMFMADFEDANSPTWENNMNGQINLTDAVNRTISLEDPKSGKSYKLNDKIATLLVRPRGLHLDEKHILVNGERTSGSLVDFGLYLLRNAKATVEKGFGPFYYLPKLEDYTEARWWNEVIVFAQDYLGIPQKTVKATVLIETITASFQIDEIIYELRDHMAGLNCGRWDYIFSYIKKFKNHKGFGVPDRSEITMESPFMAAYSLRVIQRCHKRNVAAVGGMSANIPVKDNPEANKIIIDKIVAGKTREVQNGHDGTWVAHPALVSVAMEVFDKYMPTPNQIDNKREDVNITEEQLLEMPKGKITEHGVRENINVGILYVESWLSGRGAVGLYNLMEDAATAEISRAQLWLWINSGAKMEDGRTVDMELYEALKAEEIVKAKAYVGEAYIATSKFDQAVTLFDEFIKAKTFDEFLTLKAYELI
ncbi:MAG: malate synthase A [Flavobacteriaceae bacterium]|nr:MAG: malate synthase A [Flavobacteriaceae bacterium]